MTVLSDAELHALRTLAGKGDGAIAAFLNIGDARRLTELGFAQRTQQGWVITPEGTAHLAAAGDEAAEPSDDVVAFKRD